MRRVYFGEAGHFICAGRCRFHLHTHVGRWCVSTVGEYYQHGEDAKPSAIGLDRLYETMVFLLDAKGEEPSDWGVADFDPYNTRAAANAGHETMVQKYEAT